MFKLLIEDDEGKTTSVPVARGEITIGRKEGNSIRLTDRNISRHHARISRTGDEVSIEDLGSYNGIRVNGDRISGPARLKPGDVVLLGNYRLQLRYDDPAVQARTEPAAQLMRADDAPYPPAPDLVPAEYVQEIPPQTEPEAPAPPPDAARHEPLPPAARFVIASGEWKGMVFPIPGAAAAIGRAEGNDVRIDDASVARSHARVTYESGAFRIQDLNSANGVLVNGEQIARTELKSGDTIALGDVRLTFLAGDAEPPRPSRTSNEEAPPAPREVLEEGRGAAPDGGKSYRFAKPAAALAAVLLIAWIAAVLMREKKPDDQPAPPAAAAGKQADSPVQAPLPPRPQEAAPAMPAGRLDTPAPAPAVESAAKSPAETRSLPQARPQSGMPEKRPPPQKTELQAPGVTPAPAGGSPSRPAQKARGGTQVRQEERPPNDAQPASPPAVEPRPASPEPAPPPAAAAEKAEIPEQAPAAAPKEPGYYELYSEGNKMYLQGKLPEAMDLFERAIRANPKFPQAHRSLGIVHVKNGRIQQAAEEYKIYLQLSPQAPDRAQLEKIIADFEQSKR